AGPLEFDATVSAVDPAELPQRTHKRCHAGLNFRVALRPRHEQTDPLHPAGLLRAGRERPRHRAAKKGDEVAPLHSITSSARASRVAGTSRPRAPAATVLMTSSYLVGISIGKSPGFAPLRMDAT